MKFYKLGLGNLNCSTGRKDYARKAKVMKSVCHMYVDILNIPEIWMAYAQKIKQDNARRPAFQEEFAKIIPGWKEL